MAVGVSLENLLLLMFHKKFTRSRVLVMAKVKHFVVFGRTFILESESS